MDVLVPFLGSIPLVQSDKAFSSWIMFQQQMGLTSHLLGICHSIRFHIMLQV